MSTEQKTSLGLFINLSLMMFLLRDDPAKAPPEPASA